MGGYIRCSREVEKVTVLGLLFVHKSLQPQSKNSRRLRTVEKHAQLDRSAKR
jgi:hypothetical protein